MIIISLQDEYNRAQAEYNTLERAILSRSEAEQKAINESIAELEACISREQNTTLIDLYEKRIATARKHIPEAITADEAEALRNAVENVKALCEKVINTYRTISDTLYPEAKRDIEAVSITVLNDPRINLYNRYANEIEKKYMDFLKRNSTHE